MFGLLLLKSLLMDPTQRFLFLLVLDLVPTCVLETLTSSHVCIVLNLTTLGANQASRTPSRRLYIAMLDTIGKIYVLHRLIAVHIMPLKHNISSRSP